MGSSKQTTALLLMGANIEGRKNLAAALDRLQNHSKMEVEARSSVYCSPAIGSDGLPDGKPPFYNMAAAVATTLTIGELRAALRQIEAEMGRVRVADKFAPRPIDLDIEFYGRGIASIDSMSVPDSKIGTHAHVILPLAEIAPDWLHPELELTLSEIALRLTESEVEIIKL